MLVAEFVNVRLSVKSVDCLAQILFGLHFSESVRKMFSRIAYSSPGSPARAKEEATYLMFLDLLEECESKL